MPFGMDFSVAVSTDQDTFSGFDTTSFKAMLPIAKFAFLLRRIKMMKYQGVPTGVIPASSALGPRLIEQGVAY